MHALSEHVSPATQASREQTSTLRRHSPAGRGGGPGRRAGPQASSRRRTRRSQKGQPVKAGSTSAGMRGRRKRNARCLRVSVSGGLRPSRLKLVETGGYLVVHCTKANALYTFGNLPFISGVLLATKRWQYCLMHPQAARGCWNENAIETGVGCGALCCRRRWRSAARWRRRLPAPREKRHAGRTEGAPRRPPGRPPRPCAAPAARRTPRSRLNLACLHGCMVCQQWGTRSDGAHARSWPG